MTLFTTVISFVVALGILVTIHEFGHFWVARRNGVKVLRFSIGFGKPLFRFNRRNDPTEYVVAAIPLGGYVKMLDEREGDVDPAELDQAFNRKPLGVRTSIVFAGPLFNLIFAFVAFWAILVIGETGLRTLVGDVLPGSLADQSGLLEGDEITHVGEVETPIWNVAMGQIVSQTLDQGHLTLKTRSAGGVESSHHIEFESIYRLEPREIIRRLGIQPWQPMLVPEIDQVIAGGAAARAGLKSGDRIVQVDDRIIDSWRDWVDYLRANPGKSLSVRIDREGREQIIDLTPETVEENGVSIGRIGASVLVPEGAATGMLAEHQLNPFEAVIPALNHTVHYSVLTLKMIGRLFVGSASIDNLSGPISLAQYAGQSANNGLVSFLKFLAFVSISLGIINLLPIPLLDGGHLMFYLIEFIKGSPLSEASQEAAMRLGLAVLLFVMGVALFVDFGRWF